MNQISYKTAESVTEGHPDKLCDLIADSILDACISADSESRVACEVLATKGHIIIAGEITCKETIPIRKTVRSVLLSAGYDPADFRIDVYTHGQSADIAGGVDEALETRGMGIGELGAGDQGIMYGYATNETTELLPLPVVLANRITHGLATARKNGDISGILSDGKAQVTVMYEGDRPSSVTSIVVSTQHAPDISQVDLEREIISKVLKPAFKDFPINGETDILVNPSGRFVEGGPAADTGLTGRKLMVDSYGGLASHGGGAFCGKDPTKVDRSGAYMARYIAKNIVAAGLAERCEVCLAYAIGKANPVAVDVNCFDTNGLPDADILKAVLDVFDVRPSAIIRDLGLRNIKYADTSVYGHFGKPWLPWEKTDKAETLRKAALKYANNE